MPRDDADALREYMRVDDARSLEDYLARFDVTLSVMQTRRGARANRVRAREDAARDGVRYIEMRYAPVLNVRDGLSLGEAVEAPLRGLERARARRRRVGRVIICGLRHLRPDISLELARARGRVQARGRRRRSISPAASSESRRRCTRAAFAYAQEHDLPCTCHAGEGADAASVREAVHVCGAHRIGHATRLIEDDPSRST